jgi:MFS family permease
MPPENLSSKHRLLLILATLLALFLAALDTLIMSAVMPTIVADLGGLHLYSWVFSTYLLSRAVALPVFGKLADLFPNRTLIPDFHSSSFWWDPCWREWRKSMVALTVFRAVQGIGAGGNFALVYIVLSDISEPEHRGRMMSYASFVWGLASVLGPSLGGFIVTWVSWRWIFYINVPIGLLSMAGIWFFLKETREKRQIIEIDYAGILTLIVAILSFLTIFLLGGREFDWACRADFRAVRPVRGVCSGFLCGRKAQQRAHSVLRFFPSARLFQRQWSGFFQQCGHLCALRLQSIVYPGRPGPVAIPAGHCHDVSQFRLVGRCPVLRPAIQPLG